MTNFVVAPDCFDLITGDENVSAYQFDDRIAKHYFCNRCGIFTHVSTRLNPGSFRINLGCIEGVDSLSLPTIVYDGKTL